jgi:hypothetical protein
MSPLPASDLIPTPLDDGCTSPHRAILRHFLAAESGVEQEENRERVFGGLGRDSFAKRPDFKVLPLPGGGGAEGIRTPDPHNAIVVLYQLSYDPTNPGAEKLGAAWRPCQSGLCR